MTTLESIQAGELLEAIRGYVVDVDRSQTGGMAPLSEWATSTDVTLQVSAGDARRIVRALEETSVRLSGSPSGSRLAASYIRLAAIVRHQTTAPIELAG